VVVRGGRELVRGTEVDVRTRDVVVRGTELVVGGGREVVVRGGGREVVVRGGGREVVVRGGGREVVVRGGGREVLVRPLELLRARLELVARFRIVPSVRSNRLVVDLLVCGLLVRFLAALGVVCVDRLVGNRCTPLTTPSLTGGTTRTFVSPIEEPPSPWRVRLEPRASVLVPVETAPERSVLRLESVSGLSAVVARPRADLAPEVALAPSPSRAWRASANPRRRSAGRRS